MYNTKRGTSFLRRNGLKQTIISLREKRQKSRLDDYQYRAPDICEKAAQSRRTFSHAITFSLLVPAYETKERFFVELMDSCFAQTYKNWELIVADASKSDVVWNVIEAKKDPRVKYFRLKDNQGISENTNAALEKATGEYICLLDHDDLLTVNALYEFAISLEEKESAFLYSDEDKCDETGNNFFEPHFKKEFNYDLFLSNNYICHFVAIKKDLLDGISFRALYDGAQDYDFFIQVMEKLQKEYPSTWKQEIRHIQGVLYHWRCHQSSTASNPASKMYAYDAGRRAVEDYFHRNNMDVAVTHSRHLGFYRTKYNPSIFKIRKDVGAVGGFIYKRNRVDSGPIDESTMQCTYLGLRKYYSGEMNRASCTQDVEALDIRNMVLREECKHMLEEVIEDLPAYERKSVYKDPKLTRTVSILLCKKIRAEGYEVLFDPFFRKKNHRG